MNKNLLLLLLLFINFCAVKAQNEGLIFEPLDVISQEGSNVSSITTLNDKIAFSAERRSDQSIFTYTEQNGIKQLFTDEHNNIYSSSITRIVKFDDDRFLFAASKNNATSLYISDGTVSSTKKLKNIGYLGFEFVKHNGKVYFLDSNPDSFYDIRLFVTDGTVGGTEQIIVDSNISDISSLKLYGNYLYFKGSKGGNNQIYRLDSEHNIVQLTNFNLPAHALGNYTVFNDELYVSVLDTDNKNKILQCSEGCETFIESTNNYIANFKTATYKDQLYFTFKMSNDAMYEELYRTNGEIGNFEKIEVMNQSSFSAHGYDELNTLEWKGELLILSGNAKNYKNQYALYKLVDNKLEVLFEIDNLYTKIEHTDQFIYFMGNNYDDYSNMKLIQSDGTKLGSVIVDETYIYSNSIGIIDNKVFYRKHDDLNGDELWYFDETDGAAHFVENINYLSTDEVHDFSTIHDRVYFADLKSKVHSSSGDRNDLVYHPSSFERNDASKKIFESGNDAIQFINTYDRKFIISVYDSINNSFEDVYEYNDNIYLNNPIQTINNRIYFLSPFLTEPNDYRLRLTYFDKNTLEIGVLENPNSQIKESIQSNYRGLFELNDMYYYVVSEDSRSHIMKLDATNNTSTNMFGVDEHSFYELATIIGKTTNKLVIAYNNGIYLSDGNALGNKIAEGNQLEFWSTFNVKDSNAAIINDKILFTKNSGYNIPSDLWSTDGSTEEYLDIKISSSTNVFDHIHCNNKLYIVLREAGMSVPRLYETDGTKQGTKFISLIDHSDIITNKSLACYKDNLFFVGDYYGTKISVWNNNEVKNYNIGFRNLQAPNPSSSSIYNIGIANDHLFISLYHSDVGKSLFAANLEPLDLGDMNTVNFDHENRKEKLLLYPNPTVDKINIHTASNEKIEKIVIRDIVGKIMYIEEYNHSEKINIDISNLAKGIYLVTTYTNKQIYNNRFIKK